MACENNEIHHFLYQIKGTIGSNFACAAVELPEGVFKSGTLVLSSVNWRALKHLVNTRELVSSFQNPTLISNAHINVTKTTNRAITEAVRPCSLVHSLILKGLQRAVMILLNFILSIWMK